MAGKRGRKGKVCKSERNGIESMVSQKGPDPCLGQSKLIVGPGKADEYGEES